MGEWSHREFARNTKPFHFAYAAYGFNVDRRHLCVAEYSVQQRQNKRLEESCLDGRTVKECKEKAKENGYQLLVEDFLDGENKDAKVSLLFSFTFPIIQKTKQYRIEGYAR